MAYFIVGGIMFVAGCLVGGVICAAMIALGEHDE